MRAEPLMDERHALDEATFAEIVIWRLPRPLSGSRHSFKYRLALVRNGVCVLRYDNEAGKGDHRHVRERQTPYRFADLDTLLADFWADVESRRHE
jgi:Family of unknown function (DUF6516)